MGGVKSLSWIKLAIVSGYDVPNVCFWPKAEMPRKMVRVN